MKKFRLPSFTELSVGAAVLAVVAIVSLGAPASAQQSGASASLHSDYVTGPPRVFVPGPPGARSVRSGWATDTRAKVRAPIKAIQCGHLLDVRERRVRRNVTVLTNGERITAIKDGMVRPTDADAVIDLRDQVCAPGLMDMHVHLTARFVRTGETDRPENLFDYTVSELAIGLANAREMIYSGVTTIRSPAEFLPHRASAYLNEAIEKWEFVGPRMFSASYQIGSRTTTGRVVAAGDRYYEKRNLPPNMAAVSDLLYNLADHNDVRQAVRNAVANGEEWVKVTVDTGGDLSPPMGHRMGWTQEQLQAMADEAHKHGTRITGHIETDGATRMAVLAGFDSVEHAYIPSKETADLMKERNVYWSTTLVDLTFGHDATDPRLGHDPPLSRHKSVLEQMKRRDEAFKYAYSIGVPVVYASDDWFNPSNHRGRMVLEFSQYLALGVAPWDVLKFATLNPAAMLGESNNLGSIDPGRYADIIALPRSPLEDVTAYNDVNFVMKGGNVVRDDLRRSPLPDVFALQLPDVTYVVKDPKAPFTPENLTCTGRDC